MSKKTLSKLLQDAKVLNIRCRNLMSKEHLQKSIKDTIIKYKGIVRYHDTKFQKVQVERC